MWVVFAALVISAAFGGAVAFAANATMVMVKEKANIRKGPGLRFKVLWTAYKFYPLEVVGKRDRWLNVRDFEGDEGWVARSVVVTSAAVVVKVELANIRSGASLKNPVAFKAKKGVAFKLLERKGKWIHVEHADGEQGWIYSSLVWGN